MSVDVPTILLPRDPHHEFVRVMTHATVEKRSQHYDDALGLYLARGASRFEAETRAARAIRPYEVLVGDYNAMVDNGIDLALLLLVGGGGTAFNNANARLGVGDSATAWATTQTDLVAATNKLRKGMNATYPVTGTKKQTFRSDFLTGEANWVWPPGRWRNMTNHRAISCETSVPRSSSTRARARSMPAVTPALDQTLPSRR